MTESDVKRLALVFALQAEIEGMKVENLSGVVYEKRHFDEKAEQLRNTAYCHEEQLFR